MTVTYSFDVAKATFGGFTKLLLRWRGSIYKILWKEFSVFCVAYAFLSIIYRYCLNESQRDIFERVVIYVDTFSDLIPVSFVLGFYVSLVASRWVNQYNALPWTDKVTFMIASHVHGSDNRSRMIRRTLGRYLILLQVLTFQLVSTAVKRRFPTTHHLVEAGIMTQAEESVYEKVVFPHGKWWLPCHWFTALATRAKKEGRIKDSLLYNALIQEFMKVRDNCAIMIGFDWISVPLVYTQVVTIATYLYALSLLIGKQYIDPSKGYNGYPVDLYVPIFTLLQFFFYVGWLKVAEQILNPYGEDDDDYELNWLLDRTINQVYLTVDTLHMKHPKVTEDAFWSQALINLPQTKHSARYLQNPDLGSAAELHVDEAEYIRMDELCEQDSEENHYRGESVKKKNSSSSFIKRVLAGRSLSCRQGVSNPAFSMADEGAAAASGRSSSLRRLVKKISPPVRFRLEEAPPAPAEREPEDPIKRKDSEEDFEANPDDVQMPSIPEEASRANSLACAELMGERASQQMIRVHDLVKEASEVLEVLSDRRKDNEGYHSCCSSGKGDDSSDEQEGDLFVVVEEPHDAPKH